MVNILVLYYSRHGATLKLADSIARGIRAIDQAEAIVRTVPPISQTTEAIDDEIPEHGHPYVTLEEFSHCDGLAMGSPTHFGNMAAPLKYFIDKTSTVWLEGKLVGKPTCVFTSTSSIHGGQETTLMTMMLPLLHHGAMIIGLPYTEESLNKTQTGGSPYGVTHFSADRSSKLSEHEQQLAFVQGKRLAEVCVKLQDC